MKYLKKINTLLNSLWRTQVNNMFPTHALAGIFILLSFGAKAQDAAVTAKIDRKEITVGDQARVFIEAKVNPSVGRLQWAAIPDSINDLEITKDKIDTIKDGGYVVYKQRLLITGFDSGAYTVPALVFPVIPNSGTAYTVQTDSFQLGVSTVAVDTTKGFKGIKGIIDVQPSWKDYLLYIVIGGALLLIILGVALFFILHKKEKKPLPPKAKESLQVITLRQLTELDAKQLWQKNNVKDYYVELTDIVRNYIEARFSTPALELTTDELLYKAQRHKELQPYHDLLAMILTTADLAKFAKAQPLPNEHLEAMAKSRQLVESSKPVIVTEPPIEKTI